MTVPASTRKAGPYAGNGVATQFPFAFKVFAASDVGVTLTDSNGAATTLILNSDYSVVLNADQDASPGGTITYPLFGVTYLPVGSNLTILGALAPAQLTDLTNGGRYDPQVQENVYDRLTILVQQLYEVSSRTLRAAVGSNLNLVFPAASSGKYLRWRTDLTGLENVDAGTDSMALQGLLADAGINTHGAYMIGYLPAYTNAVGRTLSSKLADNVSVKDFGATGTGTETLNIQAALNAAAVVSAPGGVAYTTGALTSTAKTINWPGGSYSSNPNQLDPLVLSNLSDAPALTFTNESRHSFSRSFGNLKANDIYNAVFPNVSSFDVESNVLHMVSGTTVANVTATAGYFKNDAAASGGNGNAVALFGCGLVTANNGAGWGINTLLQDSATRAANVGTGKVMVGAELDFNVMSPNTQLIGVSVGGNSLAQPTNASGFICNTLGNGNKWTTAYTAIDGAATYAFSAGMVSTSGVSVASQPILFQYTDGSGAKQNVQMSVQGGGFLQFTGTIPLQGYSFKFGDILIDTGKKFVVNGLPVVSDRRTGWALPTASLVRTTFDPATVTLSQLAQRVAALITDLYSGHGLIGA